MSDEWVETTLGEVAHFTNGYPFKPDDLQGTKLPVIRIKQLLDADAETDFTDLDVPVRNLIHDGDLIFSWSGTLASRFWNRGPAVLNQHLFRVTAKGGSDPGWIHLALDHAVEELSTKTHGTTMKHVTKKVLESHQVVRPPLPVQRRIVDLMTHLDNHLANLRAERAALESVLERTTIQMLMLPSDAGVPISDLLARNIGGLWGKERGTGEVSVAVFRSTEFTDLGYLASEADAQRDVTSKEFQSRCLSAGDILVEKSGGTPRRSVGRVVRVSEMDLTQPAIGANFLQLLRVNHEAVSPDYLFWVLWASHRRGDGFAYQQASTNIRNLKTKEYLGRRIELPARSEQEEDAAALDATLNAIRAVDREIERLAACRRVLLSEVLSGEVSVDDDYERFARGVA